MLKSDKNLNRNSVKGKRFRAHFFTPLMMFCFLICVGSVPLFVFLIRDIKALLACLLPSFLVLALFILLFFTCCPIICVFTKDKLYFFNQRLTNVSPSTKRKTSHVCSGWVHYDDIQYMNYVPNVISYHGLSATTTKSSEVILQGTDFQLTIRECRKCLIRKIQQHQHRPAVPSAASGYVNFDLIKQERTGFWEQVWNAFEQHKGEHILDEHFQICNFSNNETDNVIGMTAVGRNCSYCFALEEESMYMSVETRGKVSNETWVLLSDIHSLEELYKTMNMFVCKNEK